MKTSSIILRAEHKLKYSDGKRSEKFGVLHNKLGDLTARIVEPLLT
jgi:hypothetical protein